MEDLIQAVTDLQTSVDNLMAAVSLRKFGEIIPETTDFALEAGKENALYNANSDVVEIQVTCPATIDIGDVFTVMQGGTQVFEFVAGAGATILNAETKSWQRYIMLNATKLTATEWVITGGI